MPSRIPRRTRGIAHIELALILMTMSTLLPLIFSFGQIFYVYAVLKQANQDAAASLASVPMAEWAVSEPGNSPMKVRAIAIAERAMASAGIGPDLVMVPLIVCKRPEDDQTACGGVERPDAITVNLQVRLPMGAVMDLFNVGESLKIRSSVTVPYNN
ncbi:hypothetical protein INH39_12615 [Massilia violaceinigra]|uniref:Pilus assembly protein TadE n=1 Tax=Massilia violaceinigra TaxID=2045208 RepID=A0ABY4AC96_9BURK|nr:hypothetical protein [Massilia violaceinigra]UOD32418.1 hypothetical protein INH39_12615 [Massilia violaceinigra]